MFALARPADEEICMRQAGVRWIVTAAALALVVALVPTYTQAQNGAPKDGKGKGKGKDGPGGVIAVNGVRDENLPPPPVGPTPRMPDGKPDLSGVWLSGNYSFSNIGGPLPLPPWAQKRASERRASQGKDDREAKCWPAGVPRITPYPMKLVQTPKLVVMLIEANVH